MQGTGNTAFFRFYGELEDFLPCPQRGQTLPYHFHGQPGVKDPIEVFGIPHSEVVHIKINDETRDFGYQLKNGDHVAAFPLTGKLARELIQTSYEGNPRFIVDTNLGKLARWLRLLGFDTGWRNDYADRKLVQSSVAEKRIILSRDRRLLFHKIVLHGFWVRSVIPSAQIKEILQRLGISSEIRPFHRCLECNGLIHPVAKAFVINKLEPLTRQYYDEFFQCQQCQQIYWKGTHYRKLLEKLRELHKAKGSESIEKSRP